MAPCLKHKMMEADDEGYQPALVGPRSAPMGEEVVPDPALKGFRIDYSKETPASLSVSDVSSFVGTPGNNNSGEIGGTKNDYGKPDLSLIPANIQREEARALMYGERKYGRENWRGGFDYSRLMRAAMEHLLAWWNEGDLDPETRLSHLAHARCMIDFLYENHRAGRGLDDRPYTGGSDVIHST